MNRILLSLAAFLIFGASIASAQTYTRANLWQKEIDAFAETDQRQTPPANPVLFVGSSSFRMWQSVRRDFPGVNIINRGFGGSHFEDVIHYAPQTIAPYRPKTVIIYAGDNDITAGKTVSRVFEDYKTLVRLIRVNSPNARIVFVSIKPSPSRREFWGKFQELNSLVKAEGAKDRRLIYVDIWQKMLNADGSPREELYQSDRLHMKPAGYAIWRAALQNYVR